MRDVLDLLSRPIAFQPIFVEWTGSVNSALMLSQLVYWSRRTSDPEGWVYKTVKEWSEETSLTADEQYSARKKLRKSGLVEEKLEGMPARLHFRIVLKKLKKRVSLQLEEKPLTSQRKSPKQGRGKASNCHHTSYDDYIDYNRDVGNRVPHGSMGGGLVCNTGGEVSPFIARCTKMLEEFIRISRRIAPNFKRQKWYQEFRLLLKEIDGDKKRLLKVLTTYTQSPHDEFTPRADSAESFRHKFLQIEDWISRTSASRPPDDDEDDNRPHGNAVITRHVYHQD